MAKAATTTTTTVVLLLLDGKHKQTHKEWAHTIFHRFVVQVVD